MASVASQLIEEVTAHVQRDSLEDARGLCTDGTYFPNNLRIKNHSRKYIESYFLPVFYHSSFIQIWIQHSIWCVYSPHKIIVALYNGRLYNMFLFAMSYMNTLCIFCLAVGGEKKHRKTWLFFTKSSSKNRNFPKIFLLINLNLFWKACGRNFLFLLMVPVTFIIIMIKKRG